MILKDSVAVVTGSSSGIGAALVKRLASAGCNVVINYNRNESGALAIAHACEDLGVQTLVQKANVANDSECRALVEAAIEKFGRLDILVNNAGTTVFCEHSQLDGLSKDDFLDIYATNTVGAFQMIRAAEQALREQNIAHVINMASIAGISGVGSSIAYAASKGAMITMTKSLARALGPQIRVNAVCPGFVQGEWLEQGLGKEAYEKTLSALQSSAPLKDTVTPERVAETAVAIIEGMDWVTGETFIVDGGGHLQGTSLRR